MFKDTGQYSAQTEGRFNDTGRIFFFNNIDDLLLEADMILGKSSVASFDWDQNLSFVLELFFELFFLWLSKVLKVLVDSLRVLFKLLTYNLSLNCDGSLLLGPWLLEFS